MASKHPLPHDLLLAIMEHCPEATLLSFMLVTKATYDDGAKILLGRPIVLCLSEGKVRQLGSFYHFVNHDGHSRLRRIHTLTMTYLPLAAPPTTVVEQLRDCICGMTNLRKLTLYNGEALIADHPRIASAFAALESIEFLHLPGAGEHASSMLTNMRSTLKTALVISPPSQLEGRYSICQALHHMSSSLEKIGCGENFFESYPAQWYQFPSTTKLRVHWATDITLARYIDVFPNLTHLSLSSHYLWPRTPPSDMDAMRNRNLAHPQTAWMALEVLAATPVMAFILGLRRHVRRLLLCDLSNAPLEALWIASVLSDVRPTELSLTLDYHTSRSHIGDQLAHFLHDISLPESLRVLELRAIVRLAPHQLETILEQFRIAIMTAKTECSMLTTFRWQIVEFCGRQVDPESDGSPLSASVYSALEKLAQHMVAQMPWLHLAEVKLLQIMQPFSWNFDWEAYIVPSQVYHREIVVKLDSRSL